MCLQEEGDYGWKNKRRLIDANKADPRNLAFHIHADGSEYSPYERGYNDAVISCYGLLMNAPTVDAVEVVRCGRCKEWLEIEETGGAGYCNHPCWIIAGAEPPIVQFADFCSYGERRTDNA